MKIYLVGGAVRDRLLGRTVKEKDWVVVGATVADMLKLGYRQVGKDFPVFLHPKTNEEYALARTERKVGRGYTGFTFDVAPHVTLEEDLLRRDLTINAIAETPDGILIDPYHGRDDLEQRLLRHVSSAFVEDPVRILRVARFAARFYQLGFTAAPETIALMQTMVQSGEVNALVAERVWKELERALNEDHPEQFFHVLAQCAALPLLFPAIQMNQAGIKMLAKLAAHISDPHMRFAILFHELDPETIQQFVDRYRIPNDYRDLALMVAKFGKKIRAAQTLSASEIVDLFQQLDAYRREQRFNKFLQVVQAIDENTSAYRFLNECFTRAKSVDAARFAKELKGAAIAEKIRAERIQKIAELKSSLA